MKALANRRRLAIIKLLAANGNLTVEQIASHINLSFKATSKHLVILGKTNILFSKQVSRNVYYGLVDDIHPIVHTTLTHL
ncbi:metalloregulator ArsR/SmtB family transcription factor [Patescibacteria group bacterium]|nr:metalloregulator ArsR/SmtB family transcription factor [Patescibacteria group bacterium]